MLGDRIFPYEGNMIQIDFDQKIYHEIVSVFHDACMAIGYQITKDPNVKENTLTDNLYLSVKEAIGKFQNSSGSRSFSISLDRRQERSLGSDLLIRVVANWPFLTFDRFILVECKRYLLKNKVYRNIHARKGPEDHLQKQIAKMRKTSEHFSYLMLYSPRNITGDIAVSSCPPWHPIIHPQRYMPYPCTLIPVRNFDTTSDFSPTSLQLQAEYLPRIMVDNLFKGLIGEVWTKDTENAIADLENFELWTFTIGKDRG